MATLGERISLILKETDTSVPAFSRIISQSEKSAYNYVQDKNAPPASVLATFLQHPKFSHYSADWLLIEFGPKVRYAGDMVANEPIAQYAVASNGGTAKNTIHQVAGEDPCAGLRTELAAANREIALLTELVEVYRKQINQKQ